MGVVLLFFYSRWCKYSSSGRFYGRLCYFFYESSMLSIGYNVSIMFQIVWFLAEPQDNVFSPCLGYCKFRRQVVMIPFHVSAAKYLFPQDSPDLLRQRFKYHLSLFSSFNSVLLIPKYSSRQIDSKCRIINFV